MISIGTLKLTGRSGIEYNFGSYSLDTSFRLVGAVYVITKRTTQIDGSGTHDFVYVGQTGDLSKRFDDHYKADCFKRHMANCVSIHLDDNENSRLAKETDLIVALNPPCND